MIFDLQIFLPKNENDEFVLAFLNKLDKGPRNLNIGYLSSGVRVKGKFSIEGRDVPAIVSLKRKSEKTQELSIRVEVEDLENLNEKSVEDFFEALVGKVESDLRSRKSYPVEAAITSPGWRAMKSPLKVAILH